MSMAQKVPATTYPAAETDILRSVQAIMRELDGHHHPGFQCDQGMLRWTLHKKTERHPNNFAILVQILVKELERAARADNRHYLIPLLHSLMYTIIKAPFIPDDLFERAYNLCTKLFTFPKPYCIVGLDYAIRLKSERRTPGLLYQRLVTSEQSLKNETYPYHDKVFIFADPDLLSEDVSITLHGELSSTPFSQNPTAQMITVIKHTMQAALGDKCDVQQLQKTLEDNTTDVLEQYFEDVVFAVEQASEELNMDSNRYSEVMKELYTKMLGSTQTAVISTGKLQYMHPPVLNFSFSLWKDDDDIWRELAHFCKPRSRSEPYSVSQVLENFELSDVIMDISLGEQTRFSVMSNDSGIERDLPSSELPPVVEEPSTNPSSDKGELRLQRRGGIKMKSPVNETGSILQTVNVNTVAKNSGRLQRRSGSSHLLDFQEQRLYTARVIVLGDDRILGKLAKAYYLLRKRETRRPCLTLKLNLQFYYIPILQDSQNFPPTKDPTTYGTDEFGEVAAYLSQADPWYKNNINTLGHMIPKMASMMSATNRPGQPDPFITDVISYYVRMGTQPVYFQIYTAKISFSDYSLQPIEETFLTELEAIIEEPDCPKDSTLMKRKSVSVGFMGAMGTDISIDYKKVSLSNRDKRSNMWLRCTSMTLNTIPSNETEDLVCLTASLSEVVKTNTLAGKSVSYETTTFRACDIKITSQGRKTFIVCLDKDSRREYSNVVSIEVSPCLDPGYCMQRKKIMRFSLGEQEEGGITKYMAKSLLLPINTFSGVIQ
ncbi:phosphoinositide 3-kinase regulatory subunit 6 [Protopterus annectens]|uniref:phosphoinositide 3-kinase regulatory subunit 6 n=1 Tax=Protopterus annectens TaxID=7888 RepID=UPI001CFA6518|nr:phosphoinositide 3-kinase regulatory subunit 6 [Protopterus annectens]